jgi:hypothetical protein
MATQLTGSVQVAGQDIYQTSTVQNHVLGDKAFTNDGRAFRYVKAGASALVPGNAIQSAAVVPNHVNLTPTAVSAIGDTTVTVTLGATAATANQYAGGYVVVEIGTTGAGQTLKIKSHPAANSASTLLLTLEDAFYVATSGTITMSLIANRYDGVIQSPTTTLTGTVVGVAITAIPALGFGWLATRGVTSMLTTGTPIVGSAIGVPTTTAGAGVADSAILTHIGVVAKAGITAQNTPVDLKLD